MIQPISTPKMRTDLFKEECDVSMEGPQRKITKGKGRQ